MTVSVCVRVCDMGRGGQCVFVSYHKFINPVKYDINLYTSLVENDVLFKKTKPLKLIFPSC